MQLLAIALTRFWHEHKDIAENADCKRGAYGDPVIQKHS